MIRSLLTLCILPLTLAACVQPSQHPSESRYSRGETMQPQNVERCRVLEVRQVTIGTTDTRRNSYSRALGEPEEQMGTLIGGVLGAAVGHEIDDDFGTQLGAALGAAGGRAAGSRMAQRRMAGNGLEYSVLLDGEREQVITQDHNPGDRVAAPGSTCRLAAGPHGTRVLPAAQLPAQVNRPQTTTFSN